MAITVGLLTFCVVSVLLFGTLGWLFSRLQRRGRQRRAQRLDQERQQAELSWLRGMPVIAPHVVYGSEAEYDQDLQRLALMGYVPVEVYRQETADGPSFDVRYQLLDRDAFQRAARELAEREGLAL